MTRPRGAGQAPVRRTVPGICRCAAGAALTALWWWAAARLLLAPGAGALEGAVAAGGWGLSVLPVHCLPKARADGALAAGRWRRAWRAARKHGAE